MGLVKETMQAIIRIDRNLAEIRKALVWNETPRSFQTKYPQEPIEQVRSESREKTSKTFAYTEIKSIGGRICAIREHLGLLQSQLAERLAVNSSYISKLECGTSMPSETLIRLLSLIANIDEHWLATGYLPQIAEEPTKPTDRRGSTFERVMTEKDFCYPNHLTFGGRLKAVRMFNDLTQTELGDSIGVTCGHISNLEKDITNPSAMLIRAVSRRFSIDEHWLATGKIEIRGDQGEDLLKIHAVLGKVTPLSGSGNGGKLLTLDQMAGQVGYLKEAYPQTTQSKSNLTPGQLYQT